MFSLKVLHKVLRSFAFNFPIDIKRLELLNQSSLRKEKRIENLAKTMVCYVQVGQKSKQLEFVVETNLNLSFIKLCS